MKTITIDEFLELLERDDWVRDVEYDEIDEWDDGSAWGILKKINTLDNIEIAFIERIDYQRYCPYSLTFATDGGFKKEWCIEGVVVVDEDGNKFADEELGQYIKDDDFWSFDRENIKHMLDLDETINIDTEEDTEMEEDTEFETFTLYIDNEPNIRFTGVKLASVVTCPYDQCFYDKLTLYKTKNNKYICYFEDRNLHKYTRSHYSGKVCTSIDEVIDFFGQGHLAKELYEKVDIDAAVEIE